MTTDQHSTPLRKIRRAHGLTIQQVASQAGISAKQLGRYERAEQHPSLPVAARLAATLGCSTDDLVSEATI